MRKEKDEQKRISPVEAQAPSGKEKKKKKDFTFQPKTLARCVCAVPAWVSRPLRYLLRSPPHSQLQLPSLPRVTVRGGEGGI